MVSFKLTAFIATASLSLGTYARPSARDTPLWLTLPSTPKLPGNPAGTKTSVNGVQIWHAEFGTKSSSKLPVLMLHGGFGSSNYWGSVVELVMKNHYVIVMDARGQGRSTMDSTPYSFDLYARDAAGILKSLGISTAAWVGWSEGADTVLAALLNSQLSPMVARAFTTGAWHNVQANNATYTDTAIYKEFISRASAEYRAFQPNGNLTALSNALSVLESTQPTWTQSDMAKISLGSHLTLSWGEHEEAINLSEMKLLPSWIKNSKSVVMPGVSHFAPVQNPTQFATALESFLA
ncbi:alpha/beta hydrolase fold protein [Rhizoctonia solani AG-3 Rhs1AP]|uniref:Alpha/beta hydrolase fold protein n=2 Tax=Rhizoctonia solani AG-3 TaxID=1086053 RepID=A0A074RP66_9AGAM|nr:alpha/beta hydrolase fold protein [Rhizoctonia solani AG-3 Rhs1AP]KEP48856.1 alpha/beta hydrolase fold protein [Rhizoctonia solani 123E]